MAEFPGQMPDQERTDEGAEPPPPSYDEAVQMGDYQLAQSLQAEELELARTMDSTRAVPHQPIIPEGEVLPSAPLPMNPTTVWEQNVHQDPEAMIARPSQREGNPLPGYQQSLPPSIDCDCGVMTMCCCSSRGCYPLYYGCNGCEEPLDEDARSTWVTGLSRMRKAAFPVLPFWVQLIWIILQAILTLTSMSLTAAAYASRENTPVYSLVQLILLVITAIVALLDLALDLVCLGWLRKESVYAKYSDPFRIAIFELLLYPAVICSLIDILENETYKFSSNNSRLGFASSVTVGVLFIFSVYLARLVIVGTLSVRLCKRAGVKSLGICFLTGLFVNVVIQSIIQILLLVLIGIRFEAEQNDDTVNGISISSFLWIMIVLGELIPLAGIFAFFITTHKCVEDVPIEYVIREGPIEYMNQHFERKCWACFQPCVSPVQIILSVIFALLVLGFFLCFPLTLDSSGDVVTAFGERDFYGTSGSTYMQLVIFLFLAGLGVTVLANSFLLVSAVLWFFVAVMVTIVGAVAAVVVVIVAAIAVVIVAAVVAIALAILIVFGVFILLIICLVQVLCESDCFKCDVCSILD